MYIEQLELKNYRNYESIDVTFENKVNVILGENAQGKRISWSPSTFWPWPSPTVHQMTKI